MSSLAKSDIFFFVATVALVLLSILLAIFLVYAIKIAARMRDISRQAQSESRLILGEVRRFATNMNRRPWFLAGIWWFIRNVMRKYDA